MPPFRGGFYQTSRLPVCLPCMPCMPFPPSQLPSLPSPLPTLLTRISIHFDCNLCRNQWLHIAHIRRPYHLIRLRAIKLLFIDMLRLQLKDTKIQQTDTHSIQPAYMAGLHVICGWIIGAIFLPCCCSVERDPENGPARRTKTGSTT